MKVILIRGHRAPRRHESFYSAFRAGFAEDNTGTLIDVNATKEKRMQNRRGYRRDMGGENVWPIG